MDEYRGSAASPGARLFEDLMRFLPDGMTPNAWAVRAGVSRTIWADLKRHGNPSRRTLEKLLGAAGSSLAEFEALRIGDPPGEMDPERSFGVADGRSRAWRAAPLSLVPLFETAAAGTWDERGSGIELTEVRPDKVVDRLARPVSLASDAGVYAVTILGEAMWPRFRQGRRLLVSPAAAVAVGDDVLVRLVNGGGASRPASVLIKELVRRAPDGIELRQFNPDVTFWLDTAKVAAVHKVVGEAI